METFDARFNSFSKPKTKSSGKSSSSLAWPHPDANFHPTPTALADAGFFFKPSKINPDNVQCFICKKELGGWNRKDNPFKVHMEKCPKCPWAIARCSLEFDVDSKGNFSLTDSSRLPTNKVLEKARADTFGGKKWWPHDAVKNHGATSKRMAKAGFSYTPQVQGDDTATCFYCNLALSGWDAEDDPTEEHLKRVERSGKPCPFFEATERPKSQASTRSTKSNSRKSRAPKQIEITTDEGDEPITAKAPKKKGKRKQDEPERIELSSAEDTEDLEEDDDPSLKVQPAQVQKPKSKKPVSKAKPASKSTGRGRQRLPTPSEETDDTASEVITKPTRSRTRSGKTSKDQEKEEAHNKGNDKPPSNVDGKVTKSYQDFVLDLNAMEEAKEKNRHKGSARGRSASRGRSRSKSKPRSTSSTLVDRQSKPLLRASSRSRISGTTELEEMETERMLAETPSESEVEPEPEKESEPEPPSGRRRQTSRVIKERTESDEEDIEQITARPLSKASSVTSEKSTGKGNKQGKKKKPKRKKKNPDKSSSKPAKAVDQGDDLDEDVAMRTADEDPGPPVDGKADDKHMDVDTNDEQGPVPEEDIDHEKASVRSQRPLLPTPASPSDFKIAPATQSKEAKQLSNPLLKSRNHSQTPLATSTPARPSEREKSKRHSAQSKAEAIDTTKAQVVSKLVKKQASSMDVDEEHHKHSPSQSQEEGTHILSEGPAERKPVPRLSTDARAVSPEPVTPKNQIIRQPPKGNHDATDFRSALHIPPSPADLFLPPLANTPIPVIAALTEEERAMTVEQWIRHEMAVQYQRLKEDGERQIRAFLEKAEETRRQIEAL